MSRQASHESRQLPCFSVTRETEILFLPSEEATGTINSTSKNARVIL